MLNRFPSDLYKNPAKNTYIIKNKTQSEKRFVGTEYEKGAIAILEKLPTDFM